MPTRRIYNRIEDTRIRFLIDPVANETKTHIPKHSFNTLPYYSGSFVQTIVGGECGAAYLTLVAMLLAALMGASGCTMLA
jgi:hypothetical protein